MCAVKIFWWDVCKGGYFWKSTHFWRSAIRRLKNRLLRDKLYASFIRRWTGIVFHQLCRLWKLWAFNQHFLQLNCVWLFLINSPENVRKNLDSIHNVICRKESYLSLLNIKQAINAPNNAINSRKHVAIIVPAMIESRDFVNTVLSVITMSAGVQRVAVFFFSVNVT